MEKYITTKNGMEVTEEALKSIFDMFVAPHKEIEYNAWKQEKIESGIIKKVEEREKMSERSKNLKEALIRAKEAALRFADEDDGGTCNLDAPMLYLKGWKKAEIEEAVNGAELRYFDTKIFGAKFYIICGGTFGQGNRRTAMAEEMCRVLKEAGFDASMYYQMD